MLWMLLVAGCALTVDDPPPTEPTLDPTVSGAGSLIAFDDGVVVDIPAGASPGGFALTLTTHPKGVPERYVGASPHWVLGPAGTTFSRPITVELPYTPTDGALGVYAARGDGTYQAVDAILADGIATFTTRQLSSVFVGHPRMRGVALPGGSTLRLAGGVDIEVPAGAVDEPTPLWITLDADAPVHGPSPGVTFEPSDRVFDPPLTVRLRYDPADDDPRFYWTNRLGGWFQPGDAELANGVASFTTDTLAAGYIGPNGPVEDVLVPADAPVDVLLVVDDSCSMSDVQATLAGIVLPLLETMQRAYDFHLGVTTTDVSNLNPNSGLLRRATMGGSTYRFIDEHTPNASSALAQMVQAGHYGSDSERGRDAAYQLLESKRDRPRNDGFRRDDASLHIVFVSDEDDASHTLSSTEWRRWLDRQAAGVQTHAITILPSSTCASEARTGHEYLAYAAYTGGLVLDLCTLDWTPFIDRLGDRVTWSRLEQPAATPLRLLIDRIVDGQRVTITLADDEWTYDPLSQSVQFDSYRPYEDDLVRVAYTPE